MDAPVSAGVNRWAHFGQLLCMPSNGTCSMTDFTWAFGFLPIVAVRPEMCAAEVTELPLLKVVTRVVPRPDTPLLCHRFCFLALDLTTAAAS